MVLFEVVDVIDGIKHYSAERPLFSTREKAREWIDLRAEKKR